MAEFKLDRFKYNWRGDWETGISYKRDDIVRLSGKSYVCVVEHTSSEIFATDLNAILPNSNPPQPQPRWKVMTSGRQFIGAWEEGVNYNLGDIIVYDGSAWLAIESHTSSNTPSDMDYWAPHALNIGFIGEWEAGINYWPGALVRYNGVVYKCTMSHTSTVVADDLDNWEIFYFGDTYRSAWEISVHYAVNDLVKYGGSIFRCTEGHTSSAPFDDSKFVLEFPGTQFDGDWDDNTSYNVGDIVRYGGYLYYAVNNNSQSQPSRYPDDSSYDWIILSKTYNFRGTWSLEEQYKTGDIVQRGGNLYIAQRDINLTQGDASTQDYLDPDVWEKIVPGKKWSNNWSAGNLYSVGDVTYHLGTAYVCNFEHFSDNRNFPGDNGSGIYYWDTLVRAGRPGGLHDKGDLLSYGLSRDNVGDGSTLGDVRVPIGNAGDILSISEEQEAFWRKFQYDAEVIFVGPNGEDRDGFGTSVKQPFKTVRYACDYVEDNYAPNTPVNIKIATGRYEEIAPISIPQGTAVTGDELRATAVVANPPLDAYQNDWQYTESWLNFFQTIVLDIITANPITPYGDNNYTQVLEIPKSNLDAANIIANSIADYKNYIEFRVADGSIDLELQGTNTQRTDATILAAVSGLEANKDFILDEISAYLIANFGNYTLDIVKLRSDWYSLLRGLKRDIRYEGNYGSYIAAKRYANAVNGSQSDDLFYVRDTTSLAYMSTSGLTGSLNPPGVFDLYQRPTGGALVSLDPGWGPDDERVWITNRSPFIYSVTNQGSACVGSKVDGSLHNGGLKSMVYNDFTQVLDDGIGIWVSNNARAELISIFTYYCQVGYLAENGGVIRSANGNNSYGSFGSIADGNDPTEVPQYTTLNNRNNQAQVGSAFSGGSNDNIIALEYTNAGQHYTNAVGEVVGAGAGIDIVFEDFRDGGLFEARLINTKGSGSEGGAGYLVRQGSAQITEDATSTIKLSQTDVTATEEEILGMRIIIISGRGTGQYGYVQAFDPVSREVTVYKESDNTAGWDNLIPGTASVADFDSTATYRIEPRITASHPGFTAFGFTLPSSRTFYDVESGGTTATYPNIIVSNGTGETFGLDPIAARFTVERAGQDYTLTMTNPGAGYAIGDELTISGTSLGGASPANDIVITVTSATDDSTSSIESYNYTGTPVGNRFVAVADPNFVVYSDNGSDWDESNSSFAGNFVRVLAADNKFILISNNDNRISFSYNGVDWTTRSLPSTEEWIDGAYGNGVFVIVSETNNKVAYSTTGLTYSETTISGTVADFKSVAYGKGKFVAVANDRTVATSTNGITWTNEGTKLPVGTWDIINLVFGNNRFLVMSSDGSIAYSFDGINWTAGTTAPDTPAGDTMIWSDVKYAQGVFFATGNVDALITTTAHCATTEYGLQWRSEELTIERNWNALTFDTIQGVPSWVILADNITEQGINHAVTGARAKLRADIFQGTFQSMKIFDPGSGYDVENPPTLTVTDTQFTTEVETDNRVGNGVLAQPTFVSRGAGYRTSTTTVTISGNGYADIIPQDREITLDGVSVVPGPGVQIRISGILDETTEDPDDLKLFNGVEIVDLGDDGSGNGTRKVRFTISPSLENEYNLEHGTSIELRSRYSQCRITGHDFLDIGTGGFAETNYPEIYAGGAYFIAAPENEVLEENGGRVFYVSTDQDGNFRTGELFSVEQSTGIVTISAEFFDLDGLTEIALGGVRLGGSGAVVREFSTDATFAEDSNNVVPTQRAIATFLADRLSVGGENLETNQFVAGRVRVGGETNDIDITTERYLFIPVDVTFDGQDALGNQTNVSGTLIQRMMFLKDYNDTIQ